MDQLSLEDGLFERQTLYDQARRVVVKVGSAVVTNDEGINRTIIAQLAQQLSLLKATGREIILVSSGAIATGRRHLHQVRMPHEPLKMKQAFAATGQGLLMQAYEQAFSAHGQPVAQILLTHADLSSRERYLNARNTIFALFEFGVIPILNENDTVSVEELRFSDNDTLAALITNMIGADMLIILSDVSGLYTGNPATDPEARPVYTVTRIDHRIEAMAGQTTSSVGTGGMAAKIRAAKMVAACGGSSFIGPGRRADILQALFSGEPVGTFFLPDNSRAINSRKHWIAYVLKPQGELVVDAGAVRALVEKGRSLLPSGIVAVRGHFGPGAPVHCVDREGALIAAGLANYSAADILSIRGRKSAEIAAILGHKDHDEVIHRDNLVLFGGSSADD